MQKITPSAVAELHAIVNLMKRNAERNCLNHSKKETELTAMQSRIIDYLLCNSDREIFQRDIEHEFSVQPATASVLLSTMEHRDLIKRESVRQDARLKRICLTETAMRLGEDVKRELVSFEKMLVRDIPEADMEVFFQVTEQIKSNLKDYLVVKTETAGKGVEQVD